MAPKSPSKRPPGAKPPAYLSKNTPVPEPAPAKEPPPPDDPTRYGDWVRKGVAVDF